MLVRLPSWVGDAVMATPCLRALRQRFPDSHIAVQGRPHLEPLLDGAALFDAFLPTSRERRSGPANIARLRELAADVAVVLPHSLRAAYEVYRAGIPRRVGYAREGRGLFLTDSLSPHLRPGRRSASAVARGAYVGGLGRLSKGQLERAARRRPAILRERREREPILPVPMVAQYLELVGVLGASDDGGGVSLGIPDAVRASAEEDLAALGAHDGESYVAVNPGASFGETKVYPIALLAEALDALHDRIGLRTLILCGPGEEALADELETTMSSPTLNSAKRMLKLDRVKHAIARATVMVTTDTGPWHIANAVHTPAVVLMGPTDPRYTASHLERSIVLTEPVECGPCHLKRCPLDHRCMTGITPQRVVDAALQLLE